jgi:hypothetical protein
MVDCLHRKHAAVLTPVRSEVPDNADADKKIALSVLFKGHTATCCSTMLLTIDIISRAQKESGTAKMRPAPRKLVRGSQVIGHKVLVPGNCTTQGPCSVCKIARRRVARTYSVGLLLPPALPKVVQELLLNFN